VAHCSLSAKADRCTGDGRKIGASGIVDWPLLLTDGLFFCGERAVTQVVPMPMEAVTKWAWPDRKIIVSLYMDEHSTIPELVLRFVDDCEKRAARNSLPSRS
jgi:hypothetical protein